MSVRLNLGSVLVNDFWTPAPPPINFVHDQISIYIVLFRVRLGEVKTLSGPSAAARTG